jgi:hypothetical protein
MQHAQYQRESAFEKSTATAMVLKRRGAEFPNGLTFPPSGLCHRLLMCRLKWFKQAHNEQTNCQGDPKQANAKPPRRLLPRDTHHFIEASEFAIE